MNKKILVQGYSFISEDGVSVRIEETPERERIVLSLMRDGIVETASLNKAMFDALTDLRYHMDIKGGGDKEEAAKVED